MYKLLHLIIIATLHGLACNRPRIKFEASVGTHCNVQFDLGFDAPVWHAGLSGGWVTGVR